MIHTYIYVYLFAYCIKHDIPYHIPHNTALSRYDKNQDKLLDFGGSSISRVLAIFATVTSGLSVDGGSLAITGTGFLVASLMKHTLFTFLKCGYPNGWMVYFMENPNIKWMRTGGIYPPVKVLHNYRKSPWQWVNHL